MLSDDYIKRHFIDEPWVTAEQVPGSDAATYELLNHGWAVDKRRVYAEGRPLKHADRASFVVLNELYARDAHQLYAKGGSTSVIVDPSSFEVLDSGEIIDDYGAVRYQGYARDNQNVYYSQAYGSPKVVRGADAKSFISIDGGYAQDGKCGYYEGKRLPGNGSGDLEVLNRSHARNAKFAYYLNRRVEGACAKDFETIDAYTARDKSCLYDRGVKVTGIDPLTYQQLDGIYITRDARAVYVAREPQSHVDIGSFVHLGFDYFADKSGVYWQGKKVRGADRATFVADGYQEAHDRKRRYWKDGADTRPSAQSFGGVLFVPLMIVRIVWAVAKGAAGLIYSAWRHRSKADDVERHSPESRPADMRVLAETLACGNGAALSLVLKAIDDMPAFLEEFGDRESAADEPDIAEVVGRVESPDDVTPFMVMEEVFAKCQLMGSIDWRSEPDETVSQIEPMLVRFGLRDFDWAFIDTLLEQGDGTELKNCNFLSVLRDRLAIHDLVLVHINLMGDSYGFTVLPIAAYANIAGFADDEFSISTDFGADDGYDRAIEILSSGSTHDE